MSIRKILKIGDPILRKISEPVHPDELQTKEFKKLVKDMFDTMRHAEGVGLAAPQIGILKQMVVVGTDPKEDYPESSRVPERVILNPEITPLVESVDGNWEGCLSVPGMRGFVERPNKIRVIWMDEKGNRHEEVLQGYEAIVFQHECDHLKGVLYVDRLKSTKLFGFNDSMELTGPILD
ncbi:peptide deformylase [Leptospira broomii serovar Hurstbridge str. 5399]|uniref:Peptide deformylase n=1 Tax=Leptospira broomii serovar Hurstbridge str. 5399 TaxID=1049789 RepID=T0EX41_9LEPT|nr:peptide deformylase [Leptospira broomii]EQA43465.1 peptide deformylase [Leptospira broomii serovar Hurstbridge str. 5399]